MKVPTWTFSRLAPHARDYQFCDSSLPDVLWRFRANLFVFVCCWFAWLEGHGCRTHISGRHGLALFRRGSAQPVKKHPIGDIAPHPELSAYLTSARSDPQPRTHALACSHPAIPIPPSPRALAGSTRAQSIIGCARSSSATQKATSCDECH